MFILQLFIFIGVILTSIAIYDSSTPPELFANANQIDSSILNTRNRSLNSKQVKNKYLQYPLYATKQKKYYFIQADGKYREIPTNVLPLLQWDEGDVIDDIKSLKGYAEGKPILPFQINNSTGKLTNRQVFKESVAYFDNLLEGSPSLVKSYFAINNITGQYGIINAAAIPFNYNTYEGSKSDDLIFVETSRRLYGKIILLKNLKDKVEKKVTMVESQMNDLDLGIHQEDHRIFQLSDGNILVSFSALSGNGKIIATKIFDVKKQILSNINLLLLKEEGSRPTRKNWGAFTYNNELMFIDNIQPLTVVKLDGSPKIIDPPSVFKVKQKISSQYVTTVSTVDCVNLKSSLYGHYRGGTPALFVRGQYLAFYHSRGGTQFVSRTIGGVPILSEYTMGAYTFSAKPPFTLTGISQYPITSDAFHDFNECERCQDKYLMIVFPMTYYLEDPVSGKYLRDGEKELNPDSTTVVLSVGVNNEDSYVLKMNLNQLLGSIKPIVCK